MQGGSSEALGSSEVTGKSARLNSPPFGLVLVPWEPLSLRKTELEKMSPRLVLVQRIVGSLGFLGSLSCLNSFAIPLFWSRSPLKGLIFSRESPCSSEFVGPLIPYSKERSDLGGMEWNDHGMNMDVVTKVVIPPIPHTKVTTGYGFSLTITISTISSISSPFYAILFLLFITFPSPNVFPLLGDSISR